MVFASCVLAIGALAFAPVVPPDEGEARAPEESGVASQPWLAGLSVGAFVDVYASVAGGSSGLGLGPSSFRAFDADNGLSLAWAGATLRWDGPRAAATLDLRLGPAANTGWSVDEAPGIQHVKQVYLTWKASPKFAVEFGRFDTIFGAESAESWVNPTYSRGLLYNLAQPFWHTGLRVPACIVDQVGLSALVVNGWGQLIDNNAGKSYGLQLGVELGASPGSLCPGASSSTSRAPVLGLSLGYLAGPEADERIPGSDGELMIVAGVNREFRHLIDVIVALEVGDFALTFNADYVHDNMPSELGRDRRWVGSALSASQRWSRAQLGARAELIADPDGALTGTPGVVLGSGTLSVGVRPSDWLLIRLEGRFDGANQAVFGSSGAASSEQLSANLSMVVSTF